MPNLGIIEILTILIVLTVFLGTNKVPELIKVAFKYFMDFRKAIKQKGSDL